MKLIGSKTEQELREQLIKSNQLLFNGEERRLLEVIRSSYPQMNTAYIINWIPEQQSQIKLAVALDLAKKDLRNIE